jgi:hypothetical protein
VNFKNGLLSIPAIEQPKAKPINQRPAKSTTFGKSLFGLNLLSIVNFIIATDTEKNPYYNNIYDK